MRRVRPYRGENNGYPARIFTESFDPKLENNIGIVAITPAPLGYLLRRRAFLILLLA
jgi:hypothetical protein